LLIDKLTFVIGREMIEEAFIEVLSLDIVIFIAISLIIDFKDFTYSRQDMIAVGFGVIGLVGIAYLAFNIEFRKEDSRIYNK